MTDNIDPKKPGQEEPTEENHEDNYDDHFEKQSEETHERIDEEILEENHEEVDEELMEDVDVEEDEEAEAKKGLFARIPFLSSASEKMQPVMGRFPVKKIVLASLIIIILIVAGIFTMRSYHTNKLRTQAAMQVLSFASPMQDIQQYLGLNVTPGKSIIGTVNEDGQNAQIAFDAQGNKGTGKLTAVLANGQVTNLVLQTPDGQLHDVLKDQAAYKAQQAQKAEVAAEQQAVKSNFDNAVNALRSKDYQTAITGFQQSLKDNYEVAKSYEYLGFSYSQTSQYQLCVTYYEHYVQLQTDDREAYYQIAYCDLQMYQTSDALVNLDKSCKLGYAMACSAAMQIRDQLNQKPVDNGYQSLSPQQSIEQQQQMQQQLQNDSTTQQMLNNPTGPAPQGGSTTTPSTQPVSATTSDTGTTEILNGQSFTNPQGNGSMPATPAGQSGTMPQTGTMPSGTTGQPGAMPQSGSTPSTPASQPGAMPQSGSTPSTPASQPSAMPQGVSTPQTPAVQPEVMPQSGSMPSMPVDQSSSAPQSGSMLAQPIAAPQDSSVQPAPVVQPSTTEPQPSSGSQMM